MSEVIPFKKQERVCSFCKRKESACKSLLKGTATDHCICDLCIKQCKQRLEETK